MMLNSLRSRLLVSYLVVVGVCLFLVLAILVVVARPIQNRVLSARLLRAVTQMAPQVRAALRQGVSKENIQSDLVGEARDLGIDLLLVDDTGLVLADSSGRSVGTRLAGPRLAEVQGRGVSGTIVTGEGEKLTYVAARTYESARDPSVWLVATAPTPVGAPRLFGDLGEGLAVAGGLTLVMAVLLAWLVSRSVARPMQQMAKAAEAIAAGDYDYAVQVDRPTEMRVLAESLQSMAQQVKRNQQAMRDLVVNVSHDLKTPLTSVQGFAQALTDGMFSDETERRRAEGIIYEEAARMVRMVEEVVDLARIDSGEMRLALAPVDMGELGREVVEMMTLVATDRQIALIADLAPLPLVLGDRNRLKQVVTNLVDNALKYTPAGGRVRVESNQQMIHGDTTKNPLADDMGGAREKGATQEEWISLSVIDNGPGIPKDDQGRIFERFYRVDKARPTGVGSGLGLAIAWEIVTAHGGELRVESVEGLGSRFTLLLPTNIKEA